MSGATGPAENSIAPPSLSPEAAPPSLTHGAHILPLDGVRGLAILMVMVRHFYQYMLKHPTVPDIAPAIAIDKIFFYVSQLGSTGVDLFFVLSGFLITGILLDTKNHPRYWGRFYWRRTLRIFPLYYLSLLIVFYVWPHAFPGYSHVVQNAGEHKIWYWTYTCNVLFAIKEDYTGMAHFWSLAVEEQFYLIWPFVVLFFSRKGLVRACIACIFIAIGSRIALGFFTDSVLPAYVLTPSRIDALAIGSLLAAVARGPGGLTKLSKHAWWVFGVCGVFLVGLFAMNFGKGRSPLVNLLGGTNLALIFGALVLMAVSHPRGSLVPRIFCWSWLRFLGKYAYCLYVAHMLVMDAMERAFTGHDLPRVAGSMLPGYTLFAAACLAGSIGVALVSWHLWEKQFLRFKDLVK